eukprot:g11120.t1
MQRSNSINKDAKYHVFSEEERFLGTLCCKAEDVLQAGAVLSGELHIKRVQCFDNHAFGGHQKLQMFLQRKEAFTSLESRDNFHKMTKGFVAFLEDLRRGGKCAVLGDEVVLAVGKETLGAPTSPREPTVFLYIPQLPPRSPPTLSPRLGDTDESRRALQAAPPSSRLTADGQAVPTTSATPQQKGDRRALPDTPTTPRQLFPPGPGENDRLDRNPVPTGDAGAGLGRGGEMDSCAAIANRASRAREGKVSRQFAAAPPAPRPPQHMVKTSRGWVDIISLGAALGVRSSLPSGAAQANGQVRGSPGAGVGEGKIGEELHPGRERRLISRRGRGAGGTSGQGNDNPPAHTVTPGKLTAGVAVGGGATARGNNNPPRPTATLSSQTGASKNSATRKLAAERVVGGGGSNQGGDNPAAPTVTPRSRICVGRKGTPANKLTSAGTVGSGTSGPGSVNPPNPAVKPSSRTGAAPKLTPGKEVGGGASGQGNESSPDPANTPSSRISVGTGSAPSKRPPNTPSSRISVGTGSAPSKRPPGGAVGGGDRGDGAPIREVGGLERRLSRSTSSFDDSFFINLADKRHTFAFGAIAELIHNSSDAHATEVRLGLENLGREHDTNLVVVDNGHGMTHEEMAQLFTVGKDYGHGLTAPGGERIGCNGVGFKQGVLRLGNTAVVISVRGKVPAADLPPEDIPTATFGILSIEPCRRSLAIKQEREPVVVEYATLNLLTMQADERYNSRDEYEAALEIIRGLVPYFTREYLATYVARFVSRADRSAWKISDVVSSTSIFVSRLRKSPNHDGPHRFELIEDVGGTDIRLEDRKGNHALLPHRPRSCNERGRLWPPMDYSLRSFCEQMFLDPKMKIYVQGSEVQPANILASLEEKETFGIDIFDFLEQDDITDSAHEGRIAVSEEHGPTPPYNIAVHVGQDRWHRENELSGIMVYFENCLVDSYARGQGLPDVVPKKEQGYLAIVSFSGPSDKRLFHPNPTKVGFPTDNDRYIHVLEAAGEALTQVIQNVHVPNEAPLAENEEVDNWIECYRCGKSRKVSQEYYDQNEASQTWHCGIERSPVPLPEEGSNKCHTEEEQNVGRTVHYKPSATVSRVPQAPREVFSTEFTIKESSLLGKGSSASVFEGCGCQGENNALKVFMEKKPWVREKDILWALANAPGKSHPNICSLAWICREKLTLALKPLFPGSCSLSECMDGNKSHHVLTNDVRLGIAEKVADALRHLHKCELCHNDVQPSNIVLGQNPKENVLLVDFGQACRFSEKPHSRKTPLQYSPPEVLKRAGVQTKGECDMFGFGVTMVELFAGQTLFGSNSFRNESQLKQSLTRLKEKGDLVKVRFEDLKEDLPGLKALHAKDGMKFLAKICRACVNGDASLRVKSEPVVDALAMFRGSTDFHWRHGTNIVYHTLEPGDRLHFSGDGVFLGLTRLPSPSGKVSIKEHVKRGSRFGYRSQCISCSLTLAFCIFYAQKQQSMFMREKFGLAPILEIDLSKLGSGEFGKHVFDGTTEEREGKETVIDDIAENFAGGAEEVIIDGIAVPSAAVTAVWNLDCTQRTRESTTALEERVGQLEKLNSTLSSHARGRSSKFSIWEKNFNKFIRRKGGNKISSLDLIKKQARVPNHPEKGGVETILRSSYCAHRHGVEGAWPGGGDAVGRGRGARAGGASNGRVAAARRSRVKRSSNMASSEEDLRWNTQAADGEDDDGFGEEDEDVTSRRAVGPRLSTEARQQGFPAEGMFSGAQAHPAYDSSTGQPEDDGPEQREGDSGGEREGEDVRGGAGADNNNDRSYLTQQPVEDGWSSGSDMGPPSGAENVGQRASSSFAAAAEAAAATALAVEEEAERDNERADGERHSGMGQDTAPPPSSSNGMGWDSVAAAAGGGVSEEADGGRFSHPGRGDTGVAGAVGGTCASRGRTDLKAFRDAGGVGCGSSEGDGSPLTAPSDVMRLIPAAVPGRDREAQAVIDALQEVYRKSLKPIEELSLFNKFHYDVLADADLQAKPQGRWRNVD